MDPVHGSWTIAGRGPWWTDHHGRPQSSMELDWVATPRRGGFAARRENGGGDVAQPGDCSLGLEQRRGGGAPAAGLRLEAAMMWARQRGGGDELMVQECSVGARGGPFIGLGEGHRGGEGG
jgi:hypothetical protein